MSTRKYRSRKTQDKIKKERRYCIYTCIAMFRGHSEFPIINVQTLLIKLGVYCTKYHSLSLDDFMSDLTYLENKGSIILDDDTNSLTVVDNISLDPLPLEKNIAQFDWDFLLEDHFPVLYCKKQKPCKYCKTELWEFEPRSLCCKNGRHVNLKALTITDDEPMYDLYFGDDAISKSFIRNPNEYNNHFALSSFGCNSIPDYYQLNGLTCFSIHGQMRHRYQRSSRGEYSYFEGLIFDPSHMNRKFKSIKLDEDVVKAIAPILNECNVLFRHIITQYDQHKDDENVTDLSIILQDNTSATNHHAISGLPTSPEIAVLIKKVENDGRNSSYKNDIVFKLKPHVSHLDVERSQLEELIGSDSVINESESFYSVRATHPVSDALAFPFIHYKGQSGWHKELRVKSKRTSDRGKMVKVSQIDWYKRQAIQRPDEINVALHARKLTQKYFCTSYIACEDYRLNWYKRNQKNLRIEMYDEFKRWVNSGASGATGQPIILPATFIGSPKWYKRKTLEAIAMVLGIGKPDFFITFTGILFLRNKILFIVLFYIGNITWPEITENLQFGQQWTDRPDIVCRVFFSKLKKLLYLLTDKHVLGKSKACVWTVEFQKRGIPHAHILLTMQSSHKIRNTLELDKIISAEIPDPNQNPRLYDIVTSFMLHRDCIKYSKIATCIHNERCRFGFPKPYIDCTTFQEGAYPAYRRRAPANGGRVFRKRIQKRKKRNLSTMQNEMINFDNTEINDEKYDYISNQWVVPYNPVLLLLFNCHINVEFCTSILAVKYITKYVYKGPSTISYTLKKDYEPDQILYYQQSRYVTAIQAMYRLLEFKLHSKTIPVIILQVHLPNKKPIVFYEDESIENLRKKVKKNKKSTLQTWFELNIKAANGEMDVTPSPLSLTYTDAVSYFSIKKSNNEWIPREKASKAIGYVRTPRSTKSELWHLCLLLRHVKGAKSFDELKTFNGELCDTFAQCCGKHGLLSDDDYMWALLSDVQMLDSGPQLRNLFCTLLISNGQFDADKLWNKFKIGMSVDLRPKRTRQRRLLDSLTQKNTREKDMRKGYNRALTIIAQQLATVNYRLEDFKLPVPKDIDGMSRELLEHKFDNEIQQRYKDQYEQQYSQLNDEQRVIVDTVIKGEKKFIYLNAPGGCGKTFVAQTICAYFRGNNQIVLNVASTGIAATLLDNGKTVHSQFKVPIDITEESTCAINDGSHKGLVELLQKASLIIWDEAPMSHRLVFECVWHYLEKKRGSDNMIPMLLMGDFRQCTVVVPRADQATIVQSSICNSTIWKEKFDKKKLNINMRVLNAMNDDVTDVREMKRWTQYQLSIGNDSIAKVDFDGKVSNKIKLDNEIISDCNTVEDFVDYIYPDFHNQYNNLEYLSNRGILTPLNYHVNEINEICYEKLPSVEKTYYASHSFFDESFNPLNDEILNNQPFDGMPASILKLKKDTMVMCIRNLNPSIGLRNGTKLKVLNMEQRYIECQIITSSHRGNIVHIPRISFKSDVKKHSLQFTRTQFPLKLSYGMTINKSQGQTLKYVGLYLPVPVFDHGQLYTAISRCGNKDNFRVFIVKDVEQGVIEEDGEKTHYTKNIVYRDFLPYI